MKKIARMALVLAVSAGMVMGSTTANAFSSSSSSPKYLPNNSVDVGGASDVAAIEQELIVLINQHRVNNGVAPAQVSVSLMDSAKNWTNTMAQSNRLYHSRQNVGENIVMSSGKQGAMHLFEAWKNSSGHNKTMLNPRYKTIGVGVVYDAKGQTWATTQFYFR